MAHNLKVGDTIWRFDINRRVYEKPKNGRIWSSGGPLRRGHWLQCRITGETSRSWLTDFGKCPKTGAHPGWALTEQEVEDDCYVHTHRHKIGDAIRAIRDADLLRRVAEMIDYKA